MRNFIHLFVNGKSQRITGEKALWTLSDYLRIELGLVGTKIVCSEGDCGACSVLIGQRTSESELQYRSADSCILFMHQLDQTHVVSVEGLGDPNNLSAVQQAMVDCHGSQCGYCTPGFVVAMHGLFEEQEPSCQLANKNLSNECLRLGLSGNLCRCTGYQQILDAGRSIVPADVPAMEQQYPSERILTEFDRHADQPIEIQADQRVYVPQNLEQATQFLAANPDAQLVSGATDIGVQHNHGRPRGKIIMCLSRLYELNEVTIKDDALVIGAGATWTEVLPYARECFPEFADVLERFGSPQIRNFGTIGGNLANASPIADSIPFLYVIDATLQLRSSAGRREVSINEFYLGYKQLDLRGDELIESIRCPRLRSNQQLKLYKVSRRRDMDISTFTAAFLVQRDNDNIALARVALGGVGPTVLRTPKAEAMLTGQVFSLDTMQRAGTIARAEITPISDVRGSDEYRKQLAENIFAKCFYDLAGQEGAVPV